jgi:hypothetical protein
MALAFAAYAWKRRRSANIYGDDLWGEEDWQQCNGRELNPNQPLHCWYKGREFNHSQPLGFVMIATF